MMIQRYYVISCSEDGDVSVECVTKEELESKLNEEYWGSNPKFLDASCRDLRSRAGLLVIKGERVVPSPVEVVKGWGVK